MNELELRVHAGKALAEHLTSLGNANVTSCVSTQFSEPCVTFTELDSILPVFVSISVYPDEKPLVDEEEAYLLCHNLGRIGFFVPMVAKIEKVGLDAATRVSFTIGDIHLLEGIPVEYFSGDPAYAPRMPGVHLLPNRFPRVVAGNHGPKEELLQEVQFLQTLMDFAEGRSEVQALMDRVREDSTVCHQRYRGDFTGVDTVRFFLETLKRGFVETDGKHVFYFGEVDTSKRARKPCIIYERNGIRRYIWYVDLHPDLNVKTLILGVVAPAPSAARRIPGTDFKNWLNTGVLEREEDETRLKLEAFLKAEEGVYWGLRNLKVFNLTGRLVPAKYFPDDTLLITKELPPDSNGKTVIVSPHASVLTTVFKEIRMVWFWHGTLFLPWEELRDGLIDQLHKSANKKRFDLVEDLIEEARRLLRFKG